MTIETLIKYCLQYLEQDSDTDVMKTDIAELESHDTFKEYMFNIHHSIYMGLIRFATSKILPLKEFLVPELESVVDLVENGTTKRIFHKIKEVYGIDNKGNLLSNVPYLVVGSKVILKQIKANVQYRVIYYPTIHDFSTREDFYNIDLEEEFGVPDEMAINIKYMVYSDMKMEENPSVANINKNYFENYLAEMETQQVDNNQVQVNLGSWGDSYGTQSVDGESVENHREAFEDYIWG